MRGERGKKIAVHFWYEFQDRRDGMRWKRCYGLEDWTFDVCCVFFFLSFFGDGDGERKRVLMVYRRKGR